MKNLLIVNFFDIFIFYNAVHWAEYLKDDCLVKRANFHLLILK